MSSPLRMNWAVPHDPRRQRGQSGVSDDRLVQIAALKRDFGDYYHLRVLPSLVNSVVLQHRIPGGGFLLQAPYGADRYFLSLAGGFPSSLITGFSPLSSRKILSAVCMPGRTRPSGMIRVGVEIIPRLLPSSRLFLT